MEKEIFIMKMDINNNEGYFKNGYINRKGIIYYENGNKQYEGIIKMVMQMEKE